MHWPLLTPLHLGCYWSLLAVVISEPARSGDSSAASCTAPNQRQCVEGAGEELASEDSALLHLSRARSLKREAPRREDKGPPVVEAASPWDLPEVQAFFSDVERLPLKEALQRIGEDFLRIAALLGVTDDNLTPTLSSERSDCPTGSPNVQIWENFQELTDCYKKTTFYCPKTVEEVQQNVKDSSQVRSSGMRHSWTPFTCTVGSEAVAATISTNGLDKIIRIDESARFVTSEGGVKTRDLILYLAERGYVLPTISYYIDQSIAGAVATATHGSDLLPGRQTMSSLVRSMDIVMANGTLAHVDRSTDAATMRAAAVSVGKLGVVTQLSLDIDPDYCMLGNNRRQTEDEFLAWLKTIQGPDGAKNVQDPLQNQTAWQIFWWPLSYVLSGNQNTVEPPGCTPEPVSPDVVVDLLLLMQADKWLPRIMAELKRRNPLAYDRFGMYSIENTAFCKGSCMASQGRLMSSRFVSEVLIPDYKYEQYEFAVPFDKAYECMRVLMKDILSTDQARKVLAANPPLFRFVGRAAELLTFSTEFDQMLINMDIDVAHRPHLADECTTWDLIDAHFRGPTCSGRLHFGKSGWERMSRSEALAMYPNLEQFAQVMKEWDPAGKFAGGSPVFDASAPRPFLGKCVGARTWQDKACSEGGRQASECACTASGSRQPDCRWVQEDTPTPGLDAGTLRCIEDKMTTTPFRRMVRYFQGGGSDPAAVCAVTPGGGFYRGVTGRNRLLGVGPLPLVPVKLPVGLDWLGKMLIECLKYDSSGECEETSLINYLEYQLAGVVVREFNGTWSKGRSRLDGEPSAVVSYRALPFARDELRPWCVCGVRVFLGLLWLDLSAEDPNRLPYLAFVLIPPGARAGDCPAGAGSEAEMCAAA